MKPIKQLKSLFHLVGSFFAASIGAVIAIARSVIGSPIRLATLSLAFILTMGVASAHAQTAIVHVDINNGVDNPPDQGQNGWGEDAFRFLQDALDAASFLIVFDENVTDVEVWVAQGTYRPDQRAAHGDSAPCTPYGNCDREATFELRNNVAIYGGFNGDEEPHEFDNRDWENNLTILDGDLKGDDHVTIYDPITGELVLDFDENSYSENSYHVVTAMSEVVLPVEPVPGTFCDDCDDAAGLCHCIDFGNHTSLQKCYACPNLCDFCPDPVCMGTTIDNSAVLDGFHIRGAKFDSNTSAILRGGALRILGASPTIRNCVIRENLNDSSQWYAGGISIALPIPQQITMQDVTVQHNRSRHVGAGIWIGDECRGGDGPVPSVHPALLPRQIVLLAVDVVENVGTVDHTNLGQSAGGGVFVSASDAQGEPVPIEVTIVNGKIYRNEKFGNGSGMSVGHHSQLRLWNSLIHSNEAKSTGTAGGGGDFEGRGRPG